MNTVGEGGGGERVQVSVGIEKIIGNIPREVRLDDGTIKGKRGDNKAAATG